MVDNELYSTTSEGCYNPPPPPTTNYQISYNRTGDYTMALESRDRSQEQHRSVCRTQSVTHGLGGPIGQRPKLGKTQSSPVHNGSFREHFSYSPALGRVSDYENCTQT